MHRVDLTLEEDKGDRDPFDQAGREFSIRNGQGVLHCFGSQLVLLVPGAGSPVQGADLFFRMSPTQLVDQEMTE